MAAANVTCCAWELRCKRKELGLDPKHPCKKLDTDPRTREEETRGFLGPYGQSAQPINELQVQRDPVSKDKVESD